VDTDYVESILIVTFVFIRTCVVLHVLHVLLVHIYLIGQAVSGLHEKDRANLQISGKSHLLRGCIRDVKESTERHRNASIATIKTLQQHSGKHRRFKRLFPGRFSADSDIVVEISPARTQRLAYGNQVSSSSDITPPPPPFYNEFYHDYQCNQLPSVPVPSGKHSHLTEFPSGKKISLWQNMLDLNDLTEKQALIANEFAHFRGLSLLDSPASRIEMPVPSELKGLCLLRCFTRANKCLSLLIMGANNGRFAVYSVPWQGSVRPEDFQSSLPHNKTKPKTHNPGRRAPILPQPVSEPSAQTNDLSAPTLVCLSPKIPMTEACPVVDLQETALPSNQLISLDSRGVIRVWCLNPISKRKTHSSSMFTRLYEAFSPVYATCTFYVTPTEFNLPMPTPLSFFAQQRGSSRSSGSRGSTGNTPTSTPQEGTFPQKILLLPSCTALSGRTPSVLAGTAGGHLYKLNLDFKEKYFAPKFIHPAPFVDVEFMHSASVTTGAGNKKNVQMIQVHIVSLLYRLLFAAAAAAAVAAAVHIKLHLICIP
jgi:hypothetical protein